MELLLVTGAGASRDLGKPDDPLPLMRDWANSLCTALEEADSGLAGRCLLGPGMSGEEFEEALGLLLRWEQVKYLNGQFAGLTGDPGQFQALDQRATGLLGTVRHVIDQTLYQQFGQHRVDDERATAAYRWLLEKLEVDGLVLATTNYDRSCEAALSRLERKPDAGFTYPDSESVPRLEVAGLLARAADSGATPCLHLHGAIGWYQEDGVVRDFKADHEFNDTLGTPVVLYPDPTKDPTSDAHVAALWEEFRQALARAEHVMVLGHSLHDPALVSAIRAASPARLAVTYLPAAENQQAEEIEQVERIEQILPGAIPLPTEFGPEPVVNGDRLEAFRA